MVALSLALASVSLASAGPAPVAEMSVGAVSVDWHATGLGSPEKLILTVSGPDGKVFRQELEAGATPTFGLFDKEGNRRPDGSYIWELRAVPQIDPAVRKQLAAARAQGQSVAVETELRRAGRLPAGQVQSGSFAVSNGSFVGPGLIEETRPKVQRGKMTNVTAADQVIPDDLIVQGSACVGFDCVNNESFGFDTIRLKENSTRIKVEATSVGSFPSHDWQLTANDSASGGANKFSIEDITGSKVPFTITAGAATNSIFVDSTGRLGLRTATPVLDIHVSTSNTPAIRLEQTSAGGFTAQTWDIAGNEANFFVRDVTGGSRLPFRIRPGAPTSSIDISADGQVGFGTASPSVKIDAQGNSAADSGISGTTFSDTESAQFIMRRAQGTSSVPTAVVSSSNLGSVAFRAYNGTSFPATNSALVGAAAEENWTTTANGARLFFSTTPTGSTAPTTRMTIKGSGNVGIGTTTPSDKLEVAGNIRVTGGSFIDDGTTLNAPDYVFEPGYSLMPISDLRSFIAREKHLPNVPSAADIKAKGLNLSQFQMHLLEKVEELTLYTVTQEQHLADLRAENTGLKARLAAIEQALGVAQQK
jgi:hypothetical protein